MFFWHLPLKRLASSRVFFLSFSYIFYFLNLNFPPREKKKTLKRKKKEERCSWCGGAVGGRFLGRLHWIQVARSLAVKKKKKFWGYF
jgi:hypothetical protein